MTTSQLPARQLFQGDKDGVVSLYCMKFVVHQDLMFYIFWYEDDAISLSCVEFSNICVYVVFGGIGQKVLL